MPNFRSLGQSLHIDGFLQKLGGGGEGRGPLLSLTQNLPQSLHIDNFCKNESGGRGGPLLSLTQKKPMMLVDWMEGAGGGLELNSNI